MLEIQIAFVCAVVAYIYEAILMDEDKILHGWFLFLDKHYTDAKNNGKYFKERLLYMLRCDLCFSGQLALWSSLTLYLLGHRGLITCPFFSIIFTISLAILITKTFQRWT